MRLVDSQLCKCESNPIENASINATNAKVSWRFAWTPGAFSRPLKLFVFTFAVVIAANSHSQLQSAQIIERIVRLAVDAHFEVQVRSCRKTGGAFVADHIAFGDIVSD